MIISALTKAQGRLRLAQRAFRTLQKIEAEPDAFDEHWVDFLIHWKGTYTKVQQAAKETPQEMQWFGGVNHERRNDPLLRWLYEARNDEEHGLITSATNQPAVLHWKLDEPKEGEGGTIFATNAGPRVMRVTEFHPEESTLQTVTEKDGKKKVSPPTSHQGKPMEPKPLIAAELGLRWLEALVATAEAIQKP